MRFVTLASALALAAASIVLSGCSGLSTPAASAPATVTAASGMQGQVYGGRQPISGANLTLYQTGTTGYGAGATSLATTTTSANGMFSFSSFSCTSGTQIYIVANGGDPYGNGENNTYATLMSGVTSCDNIATVSRVWMSEVTTIGTVWAVSPFMNGTDIGAPANNQAGLAAAFDDIATLVDTTNGVSPGTNLPAGTTVPSAEINTLANALVSCVNSDVSSGPSMSCNNLFFYATPPGGSAPVDTLGAAIDVARNPGNNVSHIVAAGGSTVAYQPVLMTTPNDLTVAILYTGGGSISAPSSVAVDGSGNVWIANNPSSPATPSVTELSHTGADLSGSGYTASGDLDAPSAIAIDVSGDAWVANAGNSSVVELAPTGSLDGSPITGNGLSAPSSLAFDGLGNLWVANSGNNSLSEFSSTGGTISNFPATGVAAPLGIALDPY